MLKAGMQERGSNWTSRSHQSGRRLFVSGFHPPSIGFASFQTPKWLLPFAPKLLGMQIQKRRLASVCLQHETGFSHSLLALVSEPQLSGSSSFVESCRTFPCLVGTYCLMVTGHPWTSLLLRRKLAYHPQFLKCGSFPSNEVCHAVSFYRQPNPVPFPDS